MAQPLPQLPPGWRSEWNAQHGRPLYIDVQTGRTQWEPPAPAGPPQTAGPPMGHARGESLAGSSGMNAAPMGPGGGGRGSLPPGYPQQQQQQPPGQQMPPPPSASAAPISAPRTKRQYAANQADAYSGDTAGFTSHAGGAPGLAPGAQAAQPSFYSPAFGEQQHQPQQIQQPGGQYYQPGQQQPQSQQPGPYGDANRQQMAGYPGQQQQQQPQHPQYGQQGVNGVAQQFGQMGLGAKQISIQTINLMNLPLNPAELVSSPPEIRLPPGACISQNPLANADPSYQRCTLNAIPTTSTMLNKSKVPFALVCTPYRSVKPGDPEVPVITDTVIARCRRCRTYINPYVTFIEAGNRWKCCMCNLSNEVPQLFDWDQQNNQPANRWERSELNHAVVDFVAPTEYMVRAPQPPVYVFLIDVSYAAIHSGMVATAARTILETLERLPDEDNRAKICIIGVDTVLHFFSLTPGSTEPNMLVIGDLDDIFLPKPNDLLVNLGECRAGVEALLGRLNDMFKDNHTVGSALGAALQVAYKLISPIGGKVMVLSASLPSVGPGTLKNREDIKLLGTPKESSLLQAATGFYKTLAIDCSRSQVSVDMWLFASSYTDVATLSGLPRYTGGQTFFYPAFDASRTEDALKFAHEFGEVLASPILLEAVMRVRATKGLRMSAFHGNFFVRSTDLLALPAVPLDQSYTIEMQIEDPLAVPFVVFQTAVLHTTSLGERRIRVVTTAIPTTNSMSELFGSVDQIALTTLLANKAVERSLQAKIEDARDAVTNKLVDILGTYKQTMTSAGSGASPQLVTSDNMKHLPLLLLGLLKHVGLRQSAQIPSDLRAYAQALLTTLPSQLLIPYLHPTFYSLHNMPRECGTIGDTGVVLPPALPLTSERLERHGLFLIEDGQNLFLWVGQAAVPQLIKDVFDLPNYHSLHGGKTTLPVLENSFSQRVNAIIGKIRESRRGPYYPHLYVCKEDGEPSLRMWALSCLIEDAQQPLPSYNQFLTTIRERVNGSSS